MKWLCCDMMVDLDLWWSKIYKSERLQRSQELFSYYLDLDNIKWDGYATMLAEYLIFFMTSIFLIYIILKIKRPFGFWVWKS